MNNKKSLLTKILETAVNPLVIPGLIVIVIGGYFLYSIEFRTHSSPECTIGNNFNQPVTVYIHGERITKINPGDSKVIYPYDIIISPDSEVLLELKSNSGTIIYSRIFTQDEVMTNMVEKTLWIGD